MDGSISAGVADRRDDAILRADRALPRRRSVVSSMPGAPALARFARMPKPHPALGRRLLLAGPPGWPPPASGCSRAGVPGPLAADAGRRLHADRLGTGCPGHYRRLYVRQRRGLPSAAASPRTLQTRHGGDPWRRHGKTVVPCKPKPCNLGPAQPAAAAALAGRSQALFP